MLHSDKDRNKTTASEYNAYTDCCRNYLWITVNSESLLLFYLQDRHRESQTDFYLLACFLGAEQPGTQTKSPTWATNI